ncbi:hypothetical protein [Lentzea sp. NPDC003310]
MEQTTRIAHDAQSAGDSIRMTLRQGLRENVECGSIVASQG